MIASEQRIRDAVRGAIDRYLRDGGGAATSTAQAVATVVSDQERGVTESPSLYRLSVAPGSQGDGACVIEPAVRCNHCGYCQSLGH